MNTAMECPECSNSLTSHDENSLPLCIGCEQVFCTNCYYKARYSCSYFTSNVPECNWLCAEAYMTTHPEVKERVVRSGPRRRCAVVRVGTVLLRRVMMDGIIISDTPVDPVETCVYCGSFDRGYPHLTDAYKDGFACTECANGILSRL